MSVQEACTGMDECLSCTVFQKHEPIQLCAGEIRQKLSLRSDGVNMYTFHKFLRLAISFSYFSSSVIVLELLE